MLITTDIAAHLGGLFGGFLAAGIFLKKHVDNEVLLGGTTCCNIMLQKNPFELISCFVLISMFVVFFLLIFLM